MPDDVLLNKAATIERQRSIRYFTRVDEQRLRALDQDLGLGY